MLEALTDTQNFGRYNIVPSPLFLKRGIKIQYHSSLYQWKDQWTLLKLFKGNNSAYTLPRLYKGNNSNTTRGTRQVRKLALCSEHIYLIIMSVYSLVISF